MKERTATLVIAALGFFVLPGPVSAISNGEPDGTRHPAVGVLAVTRPSFDDRAYESCSGTLVGADLFLTAAHCVIRDLPEYHAGDLQFWISFEPSFDRDDKSRLIPVTEVVPNPVYDGTHSSDSGDLALIRFDPSTLPAAIVLPAPVELPPTGLLDSMQDDRTLQDTRFTVVGYGYGIVFDRGKPDFVPSHVRNVATAAFKSLGPGTFRIDEIPQLGNGGICYGDSGGPFFLGDTNLQVGVTALTDAMCRANGGALRLDTESSRAFLGQFLPLP